MKKIMIAITIFASAANADVTDYSKRQIKAFDKNCQEQGYFLVKDSVVNGRFERTLFNRLDPLTLEKNYQEQKAKDLKNGIERTKRPYPFNPVPMGPKASYAFEDAIAIMKLESQEDLLSQTKVEDGWKCLSINAIGDFNTQAQRYFAIKEPQAKKPPTFADKLQAFARKLSKK